MACGCSDSCNCLIQAGSNVDVSGNGTVGNPYIITAAPETTFSANNTDGSIEITPGGTAGHQPTIDLRIDPASTAPVTESGAGLRIDCCTSPFSLDLTVGEETPLPEDPGNYITVTGQLLFAGDPVTDTYNLRVYDTQAPANGRVLDSYVYPDYGIVTQDTIIPDVTGIFSIGGQSYTPSTQDSLNLVTDNTGSFEIGLATDTTIGTFYLVFVLPSGNIVTSSAITFT